MSKDCLAKFEIRLDAVSKRMDGMPRQDVVLTRLAYLVFKRLHDANNDNLAPYGINFSIWTALMLIYSSNDNAINPSDLSNVTVSSRTNITRLVDEMVRNGWAERRLCEEDRRKVTLSLTPEGTRLVEEVLPRQWAHYRRIWGKFTKEEKDLLASLQRKLLDEI